MDERRHGITVPERLVTIVREGPLEPEISAVLREEGYAVESVPSVSSLLELADSENFTPKAAVLRVSEDNDVGQVLSRAERVLPWAKFLLVANHTDDDPLQPATVISHHERLLRLDMADGQPPPVDLIRRFLQQDGYFWSSEVTEKDSELLFPTESSTATDTAPNKPELLETFVGRLSRHGELEPLIEEALVCYMDMLQCSAGSLYLWDPHEKKLVLHAAEGPDKEKRIGIRQNVGEGLAGWVAEARESMLVTDARRVSRLQGRPWGRYSDPSCLAVPLQEGEKLLGGVCLTMWQEQRPFQTSDLRLAEEMAEELSALISPLRVLAEMHELDERLRETFRQNSRILQQKNSQVARARNLSGDIIRGLPMGVVAFDRRLKIRSCNQRGRDILALPSPQGGARSVATLASKLDMDPREWKESLSSVLSTCDDFRLQRVNLDVGQETRSINIYGSPLRNAEGEPVGGILTLQDVTEDVRMEEKLSTAERLAMVGRIAAKVAHELNNPLDGITRFVSLAQKTLDQNPEKAHRYLANCSEGLERMNGILGQLLNFSRERQAQHRPVTIDKMVEEVLALYDERAQDNGVRIELDLPEDPPLAPGGELYDVLSNLVKNSLDAMEPDGGTLSLQARARTDEIIFRISDTGPGIPPKHRDKIFEPFFSTKKSGKGTGLGLAVCRDAVDRMGGSIELRPADEGAVFRVCLPFS